MNKFPHDRETEKALLSCLLLAGTMGKTEILDEAIAEFRDNPFFDPAHRHIWKAVKELHANGKPVEPPSVRRKITESGELEQIGGDDYLSEVYSTEVSARNWSFYAKTALELVHARKTIEIANSLIEAALDPTAAQQLPSLLNDAIAKMSAFHESKAETKPIKDVILRRIKHYEDCMKSKGKLEGLTTGIKPLDTAIRGLRAGNMIVISAPTKGGKTALALNIAIDTALAGNAVGIFSLEMNEGEIADRVISSHGGIDVASLAFAGPTGGAAQNLIRTANEVGRTKIFIRDESVLSPLQFRAAARKMVAQDHCKLILIDYLQLMEPTDPKASRERQVADCSRTIKATAQELGIPIIVMAQLNDDGRARESRAIEQDANIFIKIVKAEKGPGKDDPEPDPNQYNICVVLARDCATATIPMIFQKEFTRFKVKDFRDERA